MLKKIIFFSCLLLLCLFTAFAIYYIRTNEPDILEIKTTDVKPEKYERNFASYQFSPVPSLSDSINKYLYLPIKIDAQGNAIYIMDLEDEQIKRFNKNGRLLNTIGEGEGRGPGEMLHPNDFYIDNNTIWVIDHRLFNTNRFNIDGTYEKTFTTKYRPLRITGLNDQLIIKTIASELLFKRVDYQGTLLGEFGNLTTKQVRDPLSFTGRIEAYKNSTIYVPDIASLIFYYRADTLYHVANRPDGRNFKRSIDQSSEDRTFYRAPESDIEARCIKIFESNLYIVEFKKAVTNESDDIITPPETFVDVYEAGTGRYQHSFRTPEPTKKIWLDDEMLLLIDETDDTIKAYTYNN